MDFKHCYLSSLAALVFAAALLGCGQAQPELVQPATQLPLTADAPQHVQSPPTPNAGLFNTAGIDEPGESASPTRATSDETFEAYGMDYVAQVEPNANYLPAANPTSLAVVPAGGEAISWARYGIAGLTGDRPVQLDLNVSPAHAGDGGDVLPLYYFVGVANYTTYSWDWWGPFTTGSQVSLNHAADGFADELTERYVSATGVLQAMVITGPGTGGGGCAVQVDSILVATSTTYVWNKPHHIWFVDAHAGSSLPKDTKRVSALEPTQFINLAWNHVEPFNGLDYLNAPSRYQITRQGPGDSDSEVVGQPVFPHASFNDPLDRDAGIAEPVPGTTYTYTVQALNAAGATIPATTSITVPILPPGGVTASLDGAEPGFTLVSWNAADGATSYEVWRGDSPLAALAGLVGTVLEGGLSFEDTAAIPATTYWYFIRSVGIGDGDAANGIEPDAVSGYSLGTQGMRRVDMTISGIEPMASGSGTEVEPYLLAAGNSYQFRAYDQTGRELTIVCLWDTLPGSAGSFDVVNAGLLENIELAPNDFIAQATFSFSTYSWAGSAFCSVE